MRAGAGTGGATYCSYTSVGAGIVSISIGCLIRSTDVADPVYGSDATLASAMAGCWRTGLSSRLPASVPVTMVIEAIELNFMTILSFNLTAIHCDPDFELRDVVDACLPRFARDGWR